MQMVLDRAKNVTDAVHAIADAWYTHIQVKAGKASAAQSKEAWALALGAVDIVLDDAEITTRDSPAAIMSDFMSAWVEVLCEKLLEKE